MGMTSRGLRSQEVTSLRAYVGRKVDGFLDTDKHEGIAIGWISSIKCTSTIISFKFVYKEMGLFSQVEELIQKIYVCYTKRRLTNENYKVELLSFRGKFQGKTESCARVPFAFDFRRVKGCPSHRNVALQQNSRPCHNPQTMRKD